MVSSRGVAPRIFRPFAARRPLPDRLHRSHGLRDRDPAPAHLCQADERDAVRRRRADCGVLAHAARLRAGLGAHLGRHRATARAAHVPGRVGDELPPARRCVAARGALLRTSARGRGGREHPGGTGVHRRCDRPGRACARHGAHRCGLRARDGDRTGAGRRALAPRAALPRRLRRGSLPGQRPRGGLPPARVAAGLGGPTGALPPPALARLLRDAAARPGAAALLAVFFLVTLGFAVLEGTFSLAAADRYGYSQAQVDWLWVYMGLVAVVVQGWLVGRLARRLPERALIVLGSAALGLGFLGIPFAWSAIGLLTALALVVGGQGLASPSLSSLISKT